MPHAVHAAIQAAPHAVPALPLSAAQGVDGGLGVGGQAPVLKQAVPVSRCPRLRRGSSAGVFKGVADWQCRSMCCGCYAGLCEVAAVQECAGEGAVMRKLSLQATLRPKTLTTIKSNLHAS